MRYCEQCGAQLNDDDKFCPSCGKEVGSPVQVVEQNLGSFGGGFCLGFFLGLIGLIIGCCIHQPLTKRGAVRGFWIQFFIGIAFTVLSVVLGLLGAE